MKHLKTISTASVLGLTVMAGGAVAHANPPHCPPGHEKKGWCSNDRTGWDDRRDEQRAYEEGYRDGKRDAIRYGDRSYTDYRVIRDYDRYGLNAPPQGYYYAEMDDDIVLVMAATQLIERFIR